MNRNFYDELGIAPSATAEEIKSAYYALAKDLHPDVNGSSIEKTERYHAVKKAYEILKEPESRSHYDACGMELTAAQRKVLCHESLATAFEASIIGMTYDADLTATVRAAIQAKQKETYHANRMDLARLEKFERIKSKLRFTGEGQSPVLNAINKNIGQLNISVNTHKSNLLIFADMLELLKSYTTEQAVLPPPVAV